MIYNWRIDIADNDEDQNMSIRLSVKDQKSSNISQVLGPHFFFTLFLLYVRNTGHRRGTQIYYRRQEL
jgi:hypothetical protein